MKIVGSLDKKDLLYLLLLVAFSFIFLSQLKGISVDSYKFLFASNAGRSTDLYSISIMPLLAGVSLVVLLYIILRVSTFSHFVAFFSILLMISSANFISSFSAGSLSTPTLLMLGKIPLEISQITIENIVGGMSEKINTNLFLLPFALIGISYLFSKRSYSLFFISLMILLAAMIFPLLALIPLVFLSTFGIKSCHEESKKNDLIVGFFLILFLLLYIFSINLGINTRTLSLSVFIGIIVSAALYMTEKMHKINVVLMVSLLFLSITGGIATASNIKIVDQDTIDALNQLNQLSQLSQSGTSGATTSEPIKLSVVSIYKKDVIPIAAYTIKKDVDVEYGLNFIFSKNEKNGEKTTTVTTNTTNITSNITDITGTEKSNKKYYLLIDSLILDNPQNYSSIVNRTAKFETFWFAGKQQVNETNYLIFRSNENYLVFIVDDAGRLISDKASYNGEEVSVYRFIKFGDGGYSRYLYPKNDADMNIFKILFPDKFGELENVKLMWTSNNSRMRIYEINDDS